MGIWVPQCEHMGPLRMLEAESWSTLCGSKSTGAFPEEVSQPWFCGCGDGVPGTWPALPEPLHPSPKTSCFSRFAWRPSCLLRCLANLQRDPVSTLQNKGGYCRWDLS